MSYVPVILTVSTSPGNFPGASLPKRSRCGNSFLAFGQGSCRKACLERY